MGLDKSIRKIKKILGATPKMDVIRVIRSPREFSQ